MANDDALSGRGEPVGSVYPPVKKMWTKARQTVFLECLATTCNVRAATRAADMTVRSAYHLRRRDQAFADLWADAIRQGYTVIEAELLARAIGANDGDGRGASAGFDPELALKLMARHRGGGVAAGSDFAPGFGPGFGRKRNYRHVPIEEVEVALAAKLAVLEKRRKA